MKKNQFYFFNLIKNTNLIFLIISTYSCIDPLPPSFDFKEDLIIINAITSTEEGSTRVTVEETIFEFDNYKSKFISGCSIDLINSDTKERFSFVERGGTYIISDEFKVVPNSRWEVEVVLPNQDIYRSTSEVVPIQVPIQNISQQFNPEMTYSESYNGYIPGHEIKIDFQDPVEEKNYYLYQFRAYEEELYCQICEIGIFREGECVSQADNPLYEKEYYTYQCDKNCWKITYNDEIYVFDDEFTNGNKISNLLVGKLPYFSKQDVLIELIQLNISQEAYKYYKTIKDLVDNNNGLNSPLPTALVGNFYGISKPENIILGRFTAGSSSLKTIFVERSKQSEQILGEYLFLEPENFGDPIPDPITYFSPCEESKYRTSKMSLDKRAYFGITEVETIDFDLDQDGLLDRNDNCITISNEDQSDIDKDGIGDLCDNDADGDGYILFYEDSCDSNDLDEGSVPLDNDEDFIPDCVDEDDDNDGYLDVYEEAAETDPFDITSVPIDSDQDGLPDVVETSRRTDPNNPDTDGDGFKDGEDDYPRNPNRN